MFSPDLPVTPGTPDTPGTDVAGFNGETISVYPGTSLQYAGLLTALHGTGVVALCYHVQAQLFSVWLGGFLLIALFVSWWTQLTRDALRSDPEAVLALRSESGLWKVMTPADGWQIAELRGSHVVSRWLVIVRLRVHQGPGLSVRCDVVIPPDAVSPDSFRRLRVFLQSGLSQSGPSQSGLSQAGLLHGNQPNVGGVRIVSVATGARPG